MEGRARNRVNLQLHHSDLIPIVGDSYRLHEKTREGLFTPPTELNVGNTSNAAAAG